MSVVNYSLSGDFSGNIREDQFHSEITGNDLITTHLDGIVKKGDTISVRFFNSISDNEGNVLQQIVQSHVPDYSPVRRLNKVIPITTTNISSNNWTRIGMGKFPGTDVLGDVTYVDVQMFMDSGLPGYDVKLIDRGNVDTICTTTLTNTTLSSQNLGPILFQPQKETTLECMAKINGPIVGKKIYIQNIDVWYGN